MCTQTKKRRALFMDRDGVVIQGRNNVRPEQVRLVAGVADAITKAKQADFLAVMASNQDGQIDERPLTTDEVAAVHSEMNQQLGEKAKLDAIKYCPHAKTAEITCDCRKPKPGMLLQSADEFNIDLAASYMVGDRAIDVLAAIAAGVKGILVLSGPDGADTKEKDLVPEGTLIFPSLVEAVDWILSN